MNNVVTPPQDWRVPVRGNTLIVDGDWRFPLEANSEASCEIYVYEVENHPSLLKVGIAKDATKRRQHYYGKLLWRYQLPRRTAGMVEYLFMHSTFHRAHSRLPRCNVGNHQFDDALPSVRSFVEEVGERATGTTEVRQISLDEATATIRFILDQLVNEGVFSAVQLCGIRTFGGGTVGVGRSTVTIHRDLRWN